MVSHDARSVNKSGVKDRLRQLDWLVRVVVKVLQRSLRRVESKHAPHGGCHYIIIDGHDHRSRHSGVFSLRRLHRAHFVPRPMKADSPQKKGYTIRAPRTPTRSTPQLGTLHKHTISGIRAAAAPRGCCHKDQTIGSRVGHCHVESGVGAEQSSVYTPMRTHIYILLNSLPLKTFVCSPRAGVLYCDYEVTELSGRKSYSIRRGIQMLEIYL